MNRTDLKQEARNIWLAGKGWPVITPTGSLFMGEAIRSLGESLYSESWTGREPCAWVPSEHNRPTDKTKAAEWDRSRAEALDAVNRWKGVWSRLCQWLTDGDLPVVVRWGSGERLEVTASQYGADDAVEILASCRALWSDGWSRTEWLPAFVDAAAFNALSLGRTPGAKPDWWPDDDETLKRWVLRCEVEAEGWRRARAADLNPQHKGLCRALLVMWSEAERESTVGAIEQARLAGR